MSVSRKRPTWLSNLKKPERLMAIQIVEGSGVNLTYRISFGRPELLARNWRRGVSQIIKTFG